MITPKHSLSFAMLAAAMILGSALSAAVAEDLSPTDETAVTVEAGYGRAFGRIFLVEDGKERNLSVWDNFHLLLGN